MYILNGEQNVRPFIAGDGGVTKGDLVVFSANTVVKATTPVGAGTLVGIALETAIATATVMVDVVVAGATIIAPFTTAGTKKTMADADIGKVFDITNAMLVNPDDTTGGCASLCGYDNKTLEARFNVPMSLRYL